MEYLLIIIILDKRETLPNIRLVGMGFGSAWVNMSCSHENALLSSTLCTISMISREETVQPLSQG